jgi:hypothetical protein
MRAILLVSLLALLSPTIVLAQTPSSQTTPPPTTGPAPPTSAASRGGDITRDQYIEHAVERARRAAATRFDRLDTDHDGVLTAEERRAARAARRAQSQQ